MKVKIFDNWKQEKRKKVLEKLLSINKIRWPCRRTGFAAQLGSFFRQENPLTTLHFLVGSLLAHVEPQSLPGSMHIPCLFRTVALPKDVALKLKCKNGKSGNEENRSLIQSPEKKRTK